jgi:ribosome-associated toxin RatA of RatAB toxin-antitoxin module
MHAETALTIQAPPEVIYRFASRVDLWPDILPHYRWVRILQEDGPRLVVDMAARRDVIPVRWQAEQVLFPDIPRITFRHVGGVTKGMDVEWTFAPEANGTRVFIRHDLHLNWPLIGRFVADRIIGPFFIANIAGKTLRRMKELAESSQAASWAADAGPLEDTTRT